MIDLGVAMYIKLKCEFGQSMDCLDKACIHAFQWAIHGLPAQS